MATSQAGVCRIDRNPPEFDDNQKKNRLHYAVQAAWIEWRYRLAAMPDETADGINQGLCQ